MGDSEAELRRFFDDYLAAWNAEDAEALTTFFAIPHLIAGKRGTTFFESHTEALSNLEALVDAYRAQGAALREMLSCSLEALPDDAMLARVSWRLKDRDGMPIATLPTDYTLVAEEGGWRIVAVALKGGNPAWASWQSD